MTCMLLLSALVRQAKTNYLKDRQALILMTSQFSMLFHLAVDKTKFTNGIFVNNLHKVVTKYIFWMWSMKIESDSDRR